MVYLQRFTDAAALARPATVLAVAVATALTVPVTAAPAALQAHDDVLFSITWRGPTNGLGGSLTSGDILAPDHYVTAFNALPPVVRRAGASFGVTGTAGCPPQAGSPCGGDLDALSLGLDARLSAVGHGAYTLRFSVDSHALGAAAPPFLACVATEAFFEEQGADVFQAAWHGAPSLATTTVARRNSLLVDGNGVAGAGGAAGLRTGTGLIEPNPKALRWPISAHDQGDDLDALTLGTPVLDLPDRVYFSLAGGLVDPYDPVAAPSIPDSAALLGFSGADVLYSSPGGSPVLYASAASLGLDSSTDDLDALLLTENGVEGYQPPNLYFDWAHGQTDMLVFSVRRGSAIIGQFDSQFGLRIGEGDLLTAPTQPGATPAIVATAESLGLRSVRTAEYSTSDDLDAMGAVGDPLPLTDCNGNGVDDTYDIGQGGSYDMNENGIPDECEYDGDYSCACSSGVAPTNCGNASETRGCTNSTGIGGMLACLTLPSEDSDFLLAVHDLPASTPALILFGSTEIAPAQVHDGVLCLGGPVVVVGLARLADTSGSFGHSGVLASLGGAAPQPGQTGYFQVLYRDVGGPCGSNFNWTNMAAMTL